MTLNTTKGMEVAIIILILLTRFNDIKGMKTVINLSLLFCLYSFVFSNVTELFRKELLKNEQKK